MRTTLRFLLVTVAAASAVSCATTESHRQVRLKQSDFPKLPAASYSAKLRAKAQIDPDLRAKFFWGNYGGPGNRGGRPVDEMDWLFYRHDLAYLQGLTLRELRQSDRQLIRALREIEPDSLTLRGRAYRKRAIFYFRMPFSRWIGKPSDVLARTKEVPAVVWE